jgi:hypothetical protein
MFQFQAIFSWRWNIMPHFRDLPVARNWQIRLAESNISGSRVLVGRNNNLFVYGDNECLRTGMKNGLRVKAQRMGLHKLRQVHYPSQLCRGRGNLDRQQRVTRLGGSNEVAHRAYAAGASRQCWHFTEGATFAEFLKSPKLCNVEPRVPNLSTIVKLDGNLRMTLYPGDGIDNDFFGHCSHAPKWVFPGRSGMRPARSSVRTK